MEKIFANCDGVTEENSFAAKILHSGWLLPHSLQAGMKWVISAFHWVSPIDTNLSVLMMSTNRKQLSPESSDEEECQLQIIIKERNSRREPMVALLKPLCQLTDFSQISVGSPMQNLNFWIQGLLAQNSKRAGFTVVK